MTTVHPFAYNIGPLMLTGFGVAVLFAFVIAQIIATRELARRGHDPEPVYDLIFAAVIGGLLGAKLYYAILFQSWSALFSRGGFVFWGGLIGGALAVALVIWRKMTRRWVLRPVAELVGWVVARCVAGDDLGHCLWYSDPLLT